MRDGVKGCSFKGEEQVHSGVQWEEYPGAIPRPPLRLDIADCFGGAWWRCILGPQAEAMWEGTTLSSCSPLQSFDTVPIGGGGVISAIRNSWNWTSTCSRRLNPKHREMRWCLVKMHFGSTGGGYVGRYHPLILLALAELRHRANRRRRSHLCYQEQLELDIYLLTTSQPEAPGDETAQEPRTQEPR